MIFIFFGILILVIINGINFRYNLLSNNNNYKEKSLETSQLEVIQIDGTDPSYNWTSFKDFKK